jgi:tripeptidyl-peptidase-1
MAYIILDWSKQVLDDMSSPPLVHSVSYENEEKQQSGTDYMSACNAEFMKFGARGITALFASGDTGAFGRSGSKKDYQPGFPCGRNRLRDQRAT